MKIMKISVGDKAEMKKKHPCGGSIFRILRVGSDVRIVCESCGRDMTFERVKFEKAVKRIIRNESEEA